MPGCYPEDLGSSPGGRAVDAAITALGTGEPARCSELNIPPRAGKRSCPDFCSVGCAVRHRVGPRR